MNRTLALVASFAVVALCAESVLAQERAASTDGFDLLKSLVGEWEGKGPDGSVSSVTYRLTAAGSVIEETMNAGTEHEMVTMYHRDGGSLMMTHYCAMRNQPRMRAKPLKDGSKSLTFAFVDATNLAKASDGHMHGLVLTVVDGDHITHAWTWRAEEKEEEHAFAFTRKKS